jgi:hypothetical protein
LEGRESDGECRGDQSAARGHGDYRAGAGSSAVVDGFAERGAFGGIPGPNLEEGLPTGRHGGNDAKRSAAIVDVPGTGVGAERNGGAHGFERGFGSASIQLGEEGSACEAGGAVGVKNRGVDAAAKIPEVDGSAIAGALEDRGDRLVGGQEDGGGIDGPGDGASQRTNSEMPSGRAWRVTVVFGR